MVPTEVRIWDKYKNLVVTLEKDLCPYYITINDESIGDDCDTVEIKHLRRRVINF